MTIWTPDLSARTGPAYLAIAASIVEAVASGELAPGERLPPQRDLANRLGLSLNTVTRAYAEAIRRGAVEGAVGRGTYVRRSGPLSVGAPAVSTGSLTRPSDGPIDFANNLPFPGGAEAALARTLGDLSRTPGLGAFLGHGPDAAFDHHADAAARWIGTLGLGRKGRCLMLTNGAQQGLFAALLALTRPGDAILAEELTYPPLLSIARHLGLTVFPVALDAEGICPGAVEDLCRSTAARVLCCMPTLHTPTSATMSAARRQEVAAVAERRDLRIVEDDVFGFLPLTRPAPLAAYAPHRTVFVTSTSKSLSPGLRVGYLHAPAALEGALRLAVALSSWMPPPLMAEIATRWIEDGTAERLNEEQRAEAEYRQRLARDILIGHDLRADPSGFHVWLILPSGWRSDAFEAASGRDGVAVRSGASFAARPQAVPAAVRLCLSHEVDRDRVAMGLQRIARLMQDGPEECAFIV